MFAPERRWQGTKDTEMDASMRPGHVCPGNPQAAIPELSKGTGFNEAGACLPRKGPGGFG